MIFPKYSLGVGDRFSHQGKAQLQALVKAAGDGVDITPVWNKSHREHEIIGTHPDRVREEADAAVESLDWTGKYFVDADHIGLGNVDLFMGSSDFFTLDVADFTGESAGEDEVGAFVQKYERYVGQMEVEGIDGGFEITRDTLEDVAENYLLAVKEAGKIYRQIKENKGEGNFVTEVSMDETEDPQTPVEMLFILAAIADEGIPAQTIAPKFSGRFNKGVDYVGDVNQFRKEFNDDLAVLRYARAEFDLPKNLKLSIHSGSDKFSIYGPMHEMIEKYDAGLHIKTAGTTWLEELIGLAEAGGGGLDLARDIYKKALDRRKELCEPYAPVVDINPEILPDPKQVDSWSGDDFA
ncbi:hypothetical protein AKJ51_04940, partial [candidate division MSBL1 archaeon SCGC-AAA382A20]